jgi:hypothetical protein
VDLLTWLLLVFGVGFAICLQLLVKTTGDLSQGRVYKAPAILETPGKTASAEEPDTKAAASYESSTESVLTPGRETYRRIRGIETESTSSTTARPTELPSLRASLNVGSPGNRLLRF